MICGVTSGFADPFARPGDLELRHDLQYLDDAGAINIPLTTWPIAWGDIHAALASINVEKLDFDERTVYARLRQRARIALEPGAAIRVSAGAAYEPRIVRRFGDTPREIGNIGTGITWLGNRFASSLEATWVVDPDDGDVIRPDGSYIGMAIGNWMATIGWQDRWWGPGHDGSLILSNNARPFPALALQRNRSYEFRTRWLHWMGPWTATGFIGLLDDDRYIDNALLFGVRATFRPLEGLEVALSRTAQWCGEGRPCGTSTFFDLLLGKDNRGVNVNSEREPGNQLGGIDVRWRVPGSLPISVFAQWIAEDTRQGGPEIGSWLRQAGIEFAGSVAGYQHRTHVEVTDTSCHAGGLGFSELEPNCAYEHSIYRTGYRYNGRSIGYGTDSDGLSYSLGSTLVQSAGSSWNMTISFMEINRAGVPDTRHTLSATPQKIADLQITRDKATEFGRFQIGLGMTNIRDNASSRSSTDWMGFLQWTMD